MKRSAALQQLSRDHHHALVVAQRLKRADSRSAREARETFSAYWRTDGRKHFREEEEILLPTCAGFIDAAHPLIAAVLTDHVRIRHLAAGLEGLEDPALPALHELGLELEQHVRREERELFALIEEALPDSVLGELVERLAH
jgi:hemerythrin-like domain-containing protein